jgi:hypothetical protein
MPFEICCLYKDSHMRVVKNEDEYKRLKASGEWFESPIKMEIKENGSIRRRTRKGKNDSKC